MLNKKKTLVFVGAMILGLNTPLPVYSQPKLSLSQCQKVNYPVGLIVRSAPSSSSRRIGSLIYGRKVKLDGKKIPGINNVTPITAEDSDGTTWIKIKAPIRGFILFAQNADRDSLIPCQANLSK
jgi:Bacterial SH3 domain